MVDEAEDVATLLLRELQPLDESPHLRRVVVRDRGLDPLANSLTLG